MTTYLPAILPGGDVALARACAFSTLLQGIVSARLQQVRAREPEAGKPASMGEVAAAMSAPASLTVTSFDLHQAIIEQGRFADFATVVVVADEDGTRRDVTADEARAETFPSRVFAEAFSLFLAQSAELTTGLLGLQKNSESKLLQKTEVQDLTHTESS